MKKVKIILLAAALGLFWNAGARADNPALTAPVKSVYGHYLKIQASLAKDSMTGVAENADAIARAVQTCKIVAGGGRHRGGNPGQGFRFETGARRVQAVE